MHRARVNASLGTFKSVRIDVTPDCSATRQSYQLAQEARIAAAKVTDDV